MKAASVALQAILSSGVAHRRYLFTITLAGSAGVWRFTSGEVPITVGGHTFGTQLLITRGSTRQKAGIEVQALDLEMAPQFDHPAGALDINGVPFLKAVNEGALDGARILFEKAFLSSLDDTTPGTLPWFQGRVASAQAGGQVARVLVHSDLELLNVAMPRHVLQTGCLHTLYGPSCGLNRASFEIAGTVSSGATAISVPSSLTNPDGHFDLGILRFTSGVNNGLQRVVRSYLNSFGQMRLVAPLPSVPSAGDAFVVTPGCDKRQSTCSSKFSNLSRFRGYPYVPVPETMYDGGAASGTAPAPGYQGSLIGGSDYTGVLDPSTYVP